MLFSPQIPLQLEPQRLTGFDDFVAGPNGATVDAVRSVIDEPGSSLFLHGASSSGKSSLLNAACLEARERGLTAFYLGLKRLPVDATASVQGLEDLDLVCIDDVDRIAGMPAWEEALFHLINRIRANHGRLIVAASERLSQLPLKLPDLASRLAWGLRVELQGLDDTAKLEVVKRHASAMGFEMPDEVAAYLMNRSDRNLERLLAHVDRLRQVAFTEKRRITVPLARRVMQES